MIYYMLHLVHRDDPIIIAVEPVELIQSYMYRSFCAWFFNDVHENARAIRSRSSI